MGEGTELPAVLPAAALPRRETSTGAGVGWVQGRLAFWYEMASEPNAAGNGLRHLLLEGV